MPQFRYWLTLFFSSMLSFRLNFQVSMLSRYQRNISLQGGLSFTVIDAKTVDLLRAPNEPFFRLFLFFSGGANSRKSHAPLCRWVCTCSSGVGGVGIFEDRMSQEFGEWLAGYKL